jgi:hypothetical protein
MVLITDVMFTLVGAVGVVWTGHGMAENYGGGANHPWIQWSYWLLTFSGLIWLIVKTGNNHGSLVLVGLVNEARAVVYLSFFVLAGTIFSMFYTIQALKRSTLGGKILYLFLCASLVWCSVLILHFQLFP